MERVICFALCGGDGDGGGASHSAGRIGEIPPVPVVVSSLRRFLVLWKWPGRTGRSQTT